MEERLKRKPQKKTIKIHRPRLKTFLMPIYSIKHNHSSHFMLNDIIALQLGRSSSLKSQALNMQYLLDSNFTHSLLLLFIDDKWEFKSLVDQFAGSSLVASLRFSLKISLNDIWCLSPPKIISSSLMITDTWPSRAHGFLPTTMFELLCSGSKNLEKDYLPKSVNLSSRFFSLGSGLPITSNEFFIAWEEVSKTISFSLSSLVISKFFSISAFFW